MESNYLIILSVLQALIIFALVFYFLKMKKKDNANEDIKNHPDFVKSDSDVKSLSQQLKDAKDQIGFLKTDKQEQLKLIENVNAFKDLSEKSISNYTTYPFYESSNNSRYSTGFRCIFPLVIEE